MMTLLLPGQKLYATTSFSDPNLTFQCTGIECDESVPLSTNAVFLNDNTTVKSLMDIPSNPNTIRIPLGYSTSNADFPFPIPSPPNPNFIYEATIQYVAKLANFNCTVFMALNQADAEPYGVAGTLTSRSSVSTERRIIDSNKLVVLGNSSEGFVIVVYYDAEN